MKRVILFTPTCFIRSTVLHRARTWIRHICAENNNAVCHGTWLDTSHLQTRTDSRWERDIVFMGWWSVLSDFDRPFTTHVSIFKFSRWSKKSRQWMALSILPVDILFKSRALNSAWSFERWKTHELPWQWLRLLLWLSASGICMWQILFWLAGSSRQSILTIQVYYALGSFSCVIWFTLWTP